MSRIISANKLNRFWKNGIIPIKNNLNNKIKTKADLMANTVEGYVPDALAVKEGLKEINDSLGRTIVAGGLQSFKHHQSKHTGWGGNSSPITVDFGLSGYIYGIGFMSVRAGTNIQIYGLNIYDGKLMEPYLMSSDLGIDVDFTLENSALTIKSNTGYDVVADIIIFYS